MKAQTQIWFGLAAIACAVAQGQSLVREGAFWARSSHTDAAKLSPQVKRLELFTRGNVVIKGSEDGTLQVHLKQRVRAASMAISFLAISRPFLRNRALPTN